MSSFREQIGDGYWLVAGWAQSTGAYTSAELPTVAAILLAEVAAVAGWALVDRAVPWWTRGNRWKWRRVTAPPRCLAAGRLIEALPADRLERSPADSAALRRLGVVTQREFTQHGRPRVPACRVA